MRVAKFVVVVVGMLGASMPAFAQTISFSGSPEQLNDVRSSQTAIILQELTDRKAATRDARTAKWLDQLGTIYASMTGRPIWTDTGGFTPRALTVIDELQNAGDWGLKASDFAVPSYAASALTPSTRAKMEVGLSLAVIKYASHARGGRINPTDLSLWLDRKVQPVEVIKTVKSVAQAVDPRKALTKLQPQNPNFERIRQAYLSLLNPERHVRKKTKEDIRVPNKGPKLRPGAKHPDIAIIRHRLGVLAIRADAEVYSPDLVAAVNKFMRTQGWKRKRIVDNSVRKALNNPKKKGIKKLSPQDKKALLLVNMEKWRWMPDTLGKLHIWNNIPSYSTNVVKDDQVIHQERIIIGKTKTQTPIFSDEMTHIVFKPEWGVPSSIKIRSLLPRLASGDYGVLARRGMAIKYDNGHVKAPSRFNWSKTDIRSVPIVMGPGSSNPLGQVKFIFPNAHSVYMHDTPKKHLFKSKTRTFSHGCIRVRDPVRLAEVLLDETSGWDPAQVAGNMTRKAKDNNRILLPEPIPVHNVYFTVITDKATGKLARLEDVYGHDKRILAALNGKPHAQIAKSDPARAYERANAQLAAAPPVRRVRRPAFPNAMALGAGGYPAPKPTFFGWGQPKPKFKKSKWGSWNKKKPPKVAAKKRKSRRRQRRRAIPSNPFKVYY